MVQNSYPIGMAWHMGKVKLPDAGQDDFGKVILYTGTLFLRGAKVGCSHQPIRAMLENPW